MQSLQPRRRISVKSLKNVHQGPHWQKLLFFRKGNNFTNVFLSTRRGRFHNPTENVPAKSRYDLHQCPVLIISQFLQTKVLKTFIWTLKIYFQKPCPENFTWKAAKLFSDVKKTWEQCFSRWKSFLLRSLLWTCRLQMWPTTENFQTEWLNVLAQSPKMKYNCVRKYPNLWENKKNYLQLFFPKCFSGNIEDILENSGKKSWQKAKNLALNVFEGFKAEYLFINLFSSKCFSGQRECILDNYNKKIWQKAANIALSVIKTFEVELPSKTFIFIKLLL